MEASGRTVNLASVWGTGLPEVEQVPESQKGGNQRPGWSIGARRSSLWIDVPGFTRYTKINSVDMMK